MRPTSCHNHSRLAGLTVALVLGLGLPAALLPGARGQAARPELLPAPQTSGPAQPAPAPTAPAPAPPSSGVPASILPDWPRAAPAPYVLPAPTWPVVQFSQPDPLLDRPDAEQPGFYTNVEISWVMPYLREQLRGYVNNPVTDAVDTISYKGNPLNNAVMPRLEFGYRLANNWGGLQVDWRFLSTQGSAILDAGPLAGGPINPLPIQNGAPMSAKQQGTLNFNILDLTYASRSFALAPCFELRAGAGPRFMSLYFDNTIQFLDPGLIPTGGALAQTMSNSFYGFGGWAFCDLSWRTGIPGLCVFGRVEGMDLFARINQRYAEDVSTGPAAPSLLTYARFYNDVGVSEVRGILGLTYTVPKWNYTRFALGYQYESFFQIGRLTVFGNNPAPDTRGQLNLQGLFLRGIQLLKSGQRWYVPIS